MGDDRSSGKFEPAELRGDDPRRTLPAELVAQLALASGTLVIVGILCVLLVTWIHIRAPKLAPPAEMISLIPFALPWVVVALALVRFYGDVYPRILNTP